MFISDANRVRCTQGAGDDIGGIAGDFTNEIGDQFNVKISGIRLPVGGLSEKTEAQQIESVNRKVPRQLVEVFSPHET